MNIDGNLVDNQQIISHSSNDRILSTTDRINSKSVIIWTYKCIPVEYLLQTFKNAFPNIKYNYSSKIKIESIIKSLKLTNSYGCDEISVKILKAMSHLISSPFDLYLQKVFINWDFSSSSEIFCDKAFI